MTGYPRLRGRAHKDTFHFFFRWEYLRLIYTIMSLNKFTSADPVKSWMNIGCNSLKVSGFAIGEQYAWLTAPDDTPISQAVTQYPTLTRIIPQNGTFQTNSPLAFSSVPTGIQISQTGLYQVTVSVGYSNSGGSDLEYLGTATQEIYQSAKTAAANISVISYSRVEFISAGQIVSPWMASSNAGQTLDITSTIIRINKLS